MGTMLINYTGTKGLRILRLLNAGLLILAGGLQLVRVRWGVIQPDRSWQLFLGMVILYGVSLGLPGILHRHFGMRRAPELAMDLSLGISLYSLLLVLTPQAFVRQLPVGGLITALGILGAYMPRNSWIGIRLPGTLNSPQRWRQTNQLAERIMVPWGGLLMVAELLPPVWFVGVLIVGGIGLVMATVWSSEKASQLH